MILIFGGAYQGKLDYALEKYGAGENSVYRCGIENIDTPQNKKIIYEIDKWILALIQAGYRGEKLQEELRRFKESVINSDAVIICNDISCGVVPVDPNLRLWRETVGRLLAELSKKSKEAVRLFCGIPMRIK